MFCRTHYFFKLVIFMEDSSKKRMTLYAALCLMPFLISACDDDSGDDPDVPVQNNAQVAFMADVHFHDVYGDLGASTFKGIPTTHGNATIRTMYAELTSTRLFNENYFAFRAALDSALEKGIKLVAFPGDFSDDGQPMNVDGFKKVLQEYEKKGMRFFIAPGNHDPDAPFDNETAGKSNFMGINGQPQKIYAMQNQACLNAEADTACTNAMMEQGYESLINVLGDYGFKPNQADIYWETPYSTYNEKNYNYTQALAEATVEKRQYEICKEGEGGLYKQNTYTKCSRIPDVSYLVEPVAGVWLLSIDANVFIPTDNFDPNNPRKPGSYTGAGSAGWNKMVTHKQSTMKWIQSVAARAKLENKKLIAFSHYPTMEFYANQTDTIKQTFGDKTFQTERVPSVNTTKLVAATGLPLHVGGHMHSNSTNDYKDGIGNYLVNIQSPSLAVYGAAYKIVDLNNPSKVEVKTITLDNVPRFDELFPLYQKEHDYNMSTTEEDDPKRWNKAILLTKNYREFTHFYFGQLAQLRFMNEYWPCDMRDLAEQLNLAQMLIMSQLNTRVSYAQINDIQDILKLKLSSGCLAESQQMPTEPSTEFSTDWAIAQAKASRLAESAGLNLSDMEKVSAYDFYGDFHRTIYAGGLSLNDMGTKRVEQYKLLMKSFPESPVQPVLKDGKVLDSNPLHVPFQYKFKQVFNVLKGVGSGKPSDHFIIDYANKTLTEVGDSRLSFN